MVWKILKNIVFYLFLIVLVAVALHYFWAPRYYFPETEIFYGKQTFNPYTISQSTSWKKVGITTEPVWYENLMKRLSGDENQVMINHSYYDTLLVAGNQRIVNKSQPIYKQGLFHDDNFVIGCNKIEWNDYPFVRDIHNKQHRINKIRGKGCLLYVEPSVFFDDYQKDHPELLQNYNGFMVDESFEQVAHLWDRALSAGKYTTILAKALPKNSRFKPEKQYRIIYIPQNDRSLEQNLKDGNYFVSSRYENHHGNQRPQNEMSWLANVEVENDTLIIETRIKAYAINFFTQNGDVEKVVKNTENATCAMDRNDTYLRTEILFDDGTRYYLNPVHRYNGNKPHNTIHPHKNTFKTWLFRGIGIFGLIIVVWILLYIKRRIRIEILEPKE